MTITELYDALTGRLSEGKLRLSMGDMEKSFDRFLHAMHPDSTGVLISECDVSMQGVSVVLTGTAVLPLFCLTASIRMEMETGGESVTGTVTLSFAGEYGLTEFFSGIRELKSSP